MANMESLMWSIMDENNYLVKKGWKATKVRRENKKKKTSYNHKINPWRLAESVNKMLDQIKK